MQMVEGNSILQLTTTPKLAPLSQAIRDPSSIGAMNGSKHTTVATSIYTTFRIAQLISSFRRRIKTKVLSHRTATKASIAKVQHGLREDFQNEVLNVMCNSRGRRHPTVSQKTHVPSLSASSATGLERRAADTELSQDGPRSVDR